ncbi:LuxR C-terminal-related transcriptional regulator [Streptomyces sp. H10-C2]|uniref:helix-turn-helix transcriptional regulator n=1 Tax=unclassified Streptomyces TaxID=2593676 RepID=UPI0024BAC9C2|nr:MULTISPECIES: response regulator transcription factor family protein [unclassified Streptomyces]MDJ0343284.1 LuxR C-terminal-related transcriptional regulator [Streptomyces sp. PH10-H1]MDJ0372930.1 LuxR C-terminal-related transcriptional regulator [Streptomyces sp. H10-C2]
MAAHSSRRRTLLAVGVLEFGVLLASLTWTTHGRTTQSFIALSAMVIAAAVIGVNVRTRRSYLAALEDRAGRLERQRDQQAQLAVAGERARIAREMHAIVTHDLSVMVALADGAVFAQERHPEKAAAAMRQVSGTGRQAITDMAAGDAVVAPRITRRLLENFAHQLPDGNGGTDGDERLGRLTAREREVLIEVAHGLSNTEIAAGLHLAEATVKTHLSRILVKLGLRDRVQAVVIAYETRLIRPA